MVVSGYRSSASVGVRFGRMIPGGLDDVWDVDGLVVGVLVVRQQRTDGSYLALPDASI
jgi:hypothetical protein